MSDVQSLKDDLAFLRGLTQDDGRGLARDGFALAAVGLIFGMINAVYWLVFWGPLAIIKAQGIDDALAIDVIMVDFEGHQVVARG